MFLKSPLKLLRSPFPVILLEEHSNGTLKGTQKTLEHSKSTLRALGHSRHSDARARKAIGHSKGA